jgi:hypothetical protein
MQTLSFGKTGLFRAFFFLSIFLFTKQLSAFGPCDSIKFTLENYQSCCFRLHVHNSLFECYDELLLFIDAGTYSSFQANSAAGWTVDQISPTEILFKHNTGNIPVGISIPGTFCLEPGFDPVLSIAWANTCDLLGCFHDIPLMGCTIVADACILGVKYRECDQAIYSNQTLIPNFTINLLDNSGSIISSTVTNSGGEYSFCDLPPGNYIVREVSQAGWTPNIPANSQHQVTLLQSEIAIRNFGNCPGCSCDSIYTDVVPIEIDSDTCSYAILIHDNDGFCFNSFSLRITPGKGYLTSWTLLDSGWTVTQLDSQNLSFRRAKMRQVDYHKIILIVSGNTEHELALSSFYNIGGNDIECKKVFNFECPRKKPPTNCCPTGTTQGPELVINGDFEIPGSGPIGFVPCFPWFNPGSKSFFGSYSVLRSNQVFSANSQWSCTEYTVSSPTGKMLIVDGDDGTCSFVWQELVSVQPATQYAFCAYVNNLIIPTKNRHDPLVELWINNSKVQSLALPESPDQWQLISVLWQSGLSTTAGLQIRLGSSEAIGNDFAVDNISFRSCTKDTCICGPFELLYGIGRGPLVPKYCGDTLYVPSSTVITPIQFLSSFQCIGNICPPATIDWILTGPPGFMPLSMINVSATPGFTIPISNTTFTLPGLYTLTMTGHCGTNLCTCTIYFNADGHDCCKNQPDFELAILNAVTIGVDNTKCKATVTIGNLPKCDFIQSINWGDGNTSNGPFVTGSMLMHTYITSGTYIINYSAFETDPNNSLKCFEKTFQDTIRLVCDTCICKSFLPLSFFNASWPVATVPASCGGTSFQLPCTKPGQNFLFHGNLNCSADYCIQDSIHWNLVELNGGPLISSGSSQIDQTNGHFDITLNPTWFNPNVQYEINVTGQCGLNTCTCKINFSFEACACNCDSLATDVYQGFFVSGNELSCIRKLKPKALCPNDVVTWLVSGPSFNQQFGPSIGNNSQTIPFSISGNYSVCMFVTRTDPITHDTCNLEYCRSIKVKCNLPDPTLNLCLPNAIRNGNFTDGRVEGHMGQTNGGKIDDWKLFPNAGDGFVFVSDSSGASDDGHVILVGNKNNFAGIWQQVVLPSDNFINIGFDLIDYSNTRQDILGAEHLPTIVFHLQNDSTLNPSNKIELLRKLLIDIQGVRFDTSINIQHNPDLKYLVICLQNESDSVMSVIGLDNIELCTSKIPLSTNSEQFGKLRIYPNPSTGHYTIEMQQAATTGMIFRIIDLTGRNVFEQQTAAGNQIQNIDANKLTSGFYFLQVVSKGKILAIEKLMKQ